MSEVKKFKKGDVVTNNNNMQVKVEADIVNGRFGGVVISSSIGNYDQGYYSKEWIASSFTLFKSLKQLEQEQELRDAELSKIYGSKIKSRISDIISDHDGCFDGIEIGDEDENGDDLSVTIFYSGLEIVVVSEHDHIPVRYCTVDTKGNTPQDLREAMENYFQEEFEDHPHVDAERCFRMGLHSDIPSFKISKQVFEQNIYSINVKS